MSMSKEYKKILDRLDMLKDYCFEMEKQQQPGMWKLDGLAVQEAMDIIHDYESIVASHNRMVEHYETADMTIKRQAGVYVCPNCGKRVQVGHSHCHWCGKKVQWDREAYASRDYPHLNNRGGRNQ